MQNEITIDVQGFRKVLDMVKGCVPAKPNLPILSCVKLDWQKQQNTFTLSATNTDQHILVECAERTKTDDGTKVEQCVHMLKEDPKDGWRPVCLPYAALQEAFKLLPAARRCMVTLTEKQDGTVRQMLIDYQDGKLSLPFEPADEFPEPPAVAQDGTEEHQCRFQMAAQDLIPVMRRAKTCTADDELRPVMNSICLDCYIDKVIVVATNGHVMMKYGLEAPGYMQQVGFPVTESTRLLIPKQAMPSLVAAFSQADCLTVNADTQRIEMLADGCRLVTRCIEGRYPNYESVIPKDNPYKVQMSRESLKMALRRIQLSANSSSNMATFRADAGAFVISAEDYDFSREGSERVPIQQTDAFLPDGFAIGMKISNTLELLDLLDEDNICLYFSDPSRAFLLKNESPKLQNVTLLQMPMLVNGDGAADA